MYKVKVIPEDIYHQIEKIRLSFMNMSKKNMIMMFMTIG